MKNQYVLGGLAVIGAIALVAYFKKPKRNPDGFFSAAGETVSGNCGRRNSDGSVTYYTETLGRNCKRGFKAVRFFGDREGL
jgi:hypothetical protein